MLLRRPARAAAPYTRSLNTRHELDATARDDERLETVRPQVSEQLLHGRVRQLGVRPLEASGAAPSRASPHDCAKLVGGHARVRRRHHLEQAVLAGRGNARHVPASTDLNGSCVRALRVLRRQCLHRSRMKASWEVHRLLGPQRAVLSNTAIRSDGGTYCWAGRVRHRLDESHDARLARAVVPAWQPVRARAAGCTDASAVTRANSAPRLALVTRLRIA